MIFARADRYKGINSEIWNASVVTSISSDAVPFRPQVLSKKNEAASCRSASRAIATLLAIAVLPDPGGPESQIVRCVLFFSKRKRMPLIIFSRVPLMHSFLDTVKYWACAR